jgi:AcrR family transcriptional regulator
MSSGIELARRPRVTFVTVARTREFDEQALLSGALELFWSHGFESVSVDRISAATGVATSSIYAAYGTKLGLFLEVFARYCRARADFVADVLDAAAGDHLDAVRTYLEAIIADCAAQPGRRGCLMINTIAQLGDRVPEVSAIAAASTRRMESSIAGRLAVLDEGPGQRLLGRPLEPLSESVVLMSQGLMQMSRLGATTAQLSELADVYCRGLSLAA